MELWGKNVDYTLGISCSLIICTRIEKIKLEAYCLKTKLKIPWQNEVCKTM